MSDIVREIKNKANIISVIGERVKLERKGGRYYGLCPFHQEKTPSFMVSEHNNLYHCFGCKASGDVIKFVMDYEHLDFIEALKMLAVKYSINIESFDFSEKKSQEEKDLLCLMREALSIYKSNLDALENLKNKEYLYRRGLNDEQIKYFSLGYSQADSGIIKQLLKKNYSVQQILASGIAYLTEDEELIDRFKSRIIFPIFDQKGEVIGFGGRATKEDQQPKYLNSPETELFKKRENLFNLDKAKETIRKSNNVFVLEGYMDVISFVISGFSNSVAVLGTAFGKEHLAQLWKYCDSPTICFDGDRAGINAAHKVAELAFEFIVTGKSLKFITLPEGIDPDDLVQKNQNYKDVLNNTYDLSEYFFNYKFAELKSTNPNEIASLEKELFLYVEKIKDQNLKKKYFSYFKDQIWNITHKKKNVGKINNVTKKEFNISYDQETILELNLLLVFTKFANILKEEGKIYNDFVNLDFTNKEFAEIKQGIVETLEKESEELEQYNSLIAKYISSVFLPEMAEYEKGDVINLWYLALTKFELFNLEEEYKKSILLQEEKSLKRASALLVEIQKYKEKIAIYNDQLNF